MIGFQPNNNDSEKETTTPKPEIIRPNPSMVPYPKPDNISTSPDTEIPPIPDESPIPSTTPEMPASQVTEL